MPQDMGALSGSREPSPDGLGPSGFDPARNDYQVWPFGLGILTTGTFADMNGVGALAVCAVPDGYTRDEGGTPQTAWNASMEREGPKLLFTFQSPAVAQALADELAALAIAMEARQGGDVEQAPSEGRQRGHRPSSIGQEER